MATAVTEALDLQHQALLERFIAVWEQTSSDEFVDGYDLAGWIEDKLEGLESGPKAAIRKKNIADVLSCSFDKGLRSCVDKHNIFEFMGWRDDDDDEASHKLTLSARDRIRKRLAHTWMKRVRTVGMFLAGAALDFGIGDVTVAVIKSLKTGKQQSVAAIASLLLTELAAEFRRWVGPCDIPQAVFTLKGKIGQHVSREYVNGWLDDVGDGFGERFTTAFVQLQMLTPLEMNRRFLGLKGVLRRHVWETLEAALQQAGASDREIKVIVRAIRSQWTIEANAIAGSSESHEAHTAPDAPAEVPEVPTADVSEIQSRKLNPVLWQLLMGTIDEGSSLQSLRGQNDVLQQIWLLVLAWYAKLVKIEGGAYRILQRNLKLTFPKSRKYYCNMLPILLSDLDGTLPKELKQYEELITYCRCFCSGEKRAYLTIDERDVPAGKSQRRGGLHTECPGASLKANRRGDLRLNSRFHPWGVGVRLGHGLHGGIFMASTVADSTALYAARVPRPGVDADADARILGELGSCEHLRGVVNHTRRTLDAGEFVWMTDLTLHESLPLPKGGERQYFRLVVGKIGAWYKAHSTENPLCQLPEDVIVVEGSKYE